MFISANALTQAELTSAIIRNPLMVAPDITVMNAIQKMSGIRTVCDTEKNDNSTLDELYLDARSSCVLIVEDHQLLGIFTERDVVRLSSEQHCLNTLLIGDVMTSPVITLSESAFTDLFFAIDLLRKYKIRHIPILNQENKITGLLTNESLRQTSRLGDLLRLRLVKEVMNADVVYTDPSASMLEIAQLMTNYQISSVMIVEAKNTRSESFLIPRGILTERDIVQFQALNLNLETYQAHSVMSTPVFSVNQNDSLWAVQQIMEKRLIRRLAVTGVKGQLLGIVTQTSILQALNPLELYNLTEILTQKVSKLESEKIELLKNRTIELEQKVEARTAILKAKANQEQLITTIATQIHSSFNLQDILNTTVQQLRLMLNCDRILIWQFQSDWSAIVVAESSNNQHIYYLEQQINASCFVPWIKQYQQGHVRVVPDIYTTPMSDGHLQLLKNMYIRAKILVPIIQGENLWGLINAIESNKPRQWQSQEITLLQQLATQLAIAIKQTTAYQQLQSELAERKKAETALIESKNLYATLTAVAPVGIFRTDAEGKCIYVNERWCYISGLTYQEAMGTGWIKAIHPEDRDKIAFEWAQAVRENSPFQLEYRFLRADGVVTWVYGQDIAQRNAQGDIVGYVGTITDINERKQTSQILQNLIEGTATVTGRDFFPALAEHISKAFQLDRIVITELRDGIFLKLVDLSNRKLKSNFDHKHLADLYAKSDLGIDLRNREGQLIGYIAMWNKHLKYAANLIHIVDILQVFAVRAETEIERLRATEALQKSNQELRQAKADLKQLNQCLENRVEERTQELSQTLKELSNFKYAIDQSAIVAITDRKGVITYANDLFCQISQYTRQELLGNTHKIVNSGDHPPEFFMQMWQTITKGQTWRGEIKNKKKDGSFYWVDTRIIPFLDALGKPFEYLAIRSDITERKQYENQLQQKNIELVRATRLKDEFLANMSHELRTPLNAILGMTEALQSEVFGKIDQEKISALQTIQTSGGHLLALINDILDVAKIESGKLKLHPTITNLNELCQCSLNFIKHRVMQKDIEIEMNISANLPNLLVDERRIQQVLINLLDNAVKFTPNGGKVTLEVTQISAPVKKKSDSDSFPEQQKHQSPLSPQKMIRFAVIDTGIGIDPQNFKKLFQPFVQIDSALNRQYAGTGLGLTLVKRIVELHGGNVEVNSKLGVGSCFTINLPYSEQQIKIAEVPNQLSNLQDNINTNITEKMPLILLAEDNATNIITMSRYLKAKGYRMILAKDGQEAIDVTISNIPGLILMDISMPKMDGLEAIKQIRNHPSPQVANIPIIALTALAMTGDREKCLEAGANEYLTKPVKLAQLTSTIQQIIREWGIGNGE